MRNLNLVFLQIVLILLIIPQKVIGIDSLKYNVSCYYQKDLSDTYGKGYLFAADFGINKEWYGISFSLGHFQSHSIFNYIINIEEINKEISISFDEVTIMPSGSLSFKIIPVQTQVFTTELFFGLAFNRAQNLRFNAVDYRYSIIEDKFIYLYKDYKLVKRNHFGYQVGINASFYFSSKIGFQINAKMQDLSNSGDFIFIGTGLCFKF